MGLNERALDCAAGLDGWVGRFHGDCAAVVRELVAENERLLACVRESNGAVLASAMARLSPGSVEYEAFIENCRAKIVEKRREQTGEPPRIVTSLRKLAEEIDAKRVAILEGTISVALGDPLTMSLKGTTYERVIKIDLRLKPLELAA